LDEQKGYELMKPGDLAEFVIGPANAVVVEEVDTVAYYLWRSVSGATGGAISPCVAFDLPVEIGCKNTLRGQIEDVFVYSVSQIVRVSYSDDVGRLHQCTVPRSALRLLDV
jgi:hypothetical protein